MRSLKPTRKPSVHSLRPYIQFLLVHCPVRLKSNFGMSGQNSIQLALFLRLTFTRFGLPFGWPKLDPVSLSSKANLHFFRPSIQFPISELLL